VRYDKSGLVLLNLVEIATGEELPYGELQALGTRNRVPVAEAFDRPLAECAAEDIPNEEGYVAATRNHPAARQNQIRQLRPVAPPAHPNQRRHRMGDAARRVGRSRADGGCSSRVPRLDRCDAPPLSGEFAAIEEAAMASYTGGRDATDPEQKKAFALWVNGEHKALAPILFSMIDGKEYAPVIWKSIRPLGDEPPFKEDDA
jgi:hypothetical protein